MIDTPDKDVSVWVDHEKRCVYLRRIGLVDRDKSIENYRLIVGVDGYDPAYRVIIDYRDVGQIDIGFHDMKDVFKATDELVEGESKVAIVVGNHISRLILAKLFFEISGLFSTVKVEWGAFKTMKEAGAWIDS